MTHRKMINEAEISAILDVCSQTGTDPKTKQDICQVILADVIDVLLIKIHITEKEVKILQRRLNTLCGLANNEQQSLN